MTDPARHEPPMPNRAEVHAGPRVAPPAPGRLPALEAHERELLLALDELRRIAGVHRYRTDPLFQARKGQLKRVAAFLSRRLREEPDDDEVASALAWARTHLGLPVA